MKQIEHITNNINIVSLEHRYTIARILDFRGYQLTQTNNGAYILLKDIDEETINDIYVLLKTKLSS